MINKNIHFVWHQGWNEFPEKYLTNVESVINKNFDWKIYQWDNESIRAELKNLGQQYLDKYDSFKILHQQIDYARYALLYIYGGASVDTDVIGLKGFDSTPNIDTSNFIVSEKPHNKSINNATILASKNNPILKHVIDNIDTTPCGEYETDYKCIQRTTGPRAFNELLQPFRNEITVLDKSYFEPCASLDPFCDPKENSVLDHRHELSWLKFYHRDAIRLYFIIRRYRFHILIGLVIIFVITLILQKKQ